MAYEKLTVNCFMSVLCVQAASPACAELETIVLDWLGSYCRKYV